jgi:hypothetical protein
MEFKILTYEEYLKQWPNKYDGKCTCAMPECDKPAYYEGGDARCWFPVCEEHSGLSDRYMKYLLSIRKQIRTRKLWDKKDTSLDSLLVRVEELIESRK